MSDDEHTDFDDGTGGEDPADSTDFADSDAFLAELRKGRQPVDDAVALSRTEQAESVERFRQLTESAEAGEPSAMFELSKCFGMGLGVAADMAAAKKWCRAAIDKGHLGARSYLANAYEQGSFVEKDLLKAEHWHRSAACNINYSKEDRVQAQGHLDRFLKANGKNVQAAADAGAGGGEVLEFVANKAAAGRPLQAEPASTFHGELEDESSPVPTTEQGVNRWAQRAEYLGRSLRTEADRVRRVAELNTAQGEKKRMEAVEQAAQAKVLAAAGGSGVEDLVGRMVATALTLPLTLSKSVWDGINHVRREQLDKMYSENLQKVEKQLPAGLAAMQSSVNAIKASDSFSRHQQCKKGDLAAQRKVYLDDPRFFRSLLQAQVRAETLNRDFNRALAATKSMPRDQSTVGRVEDLLGKAEQFKQICDQVPDLEAPGTRERLRLMAERLLKDLREFIELLLRSLGLKRTPAASTAWPVEEPVAWEPQMGGG